MPTTSVKEFLDQTWKDYHRAAPDAPKIEELLKKRGEDFVNDHVAYRTYGIDGIRRKDLGRIFEAWGYKMIDDELDFPEKKLKANYWIHDDPKLPKVFISELLLEKCSPQLQGWVRSFAEPAAKKIAQAGGVEPKHLIGTAWAPIQHEDYERFYPESEYAAWTAAFGIRANHFTVLVNSLKTFKSLQELNAFLTTSGFVLNDAGGVIKGTPDQLLEQSSTMGKRVEWDFAGGVKKPVMGCYYEFARRYPLPGAGGKLFQGFIPKSADKIFESTFEKK